MFDVVVHWSKPFLAFAFFPLVQEIAGLRRKKPVKPKPKDCGRFVRFYRSLETGREENSSGEATSSRNSEINQHIEYDLVFARQLQAMDNLTIETPADEDDDISCVPRN
uniref:Uncharacterized protein n=1 Tax=Oryza barthii TaxID=65489 RepID=A0A0D3HCG1_9ORYZ